jgi:hypothetical protein
VAGLVGLGLSGLFAGSGLESKSLLSKKGDDLSNQMGLLLQKTNIIRDYLEDLVGAVTCFRFANHCLPAFYRVQSLVFAYDNHHLHLPLPLPLH